MTITKDAVTASPETIPAGYVIFSVINLAPGTCGGACFVIDPATNKEHAVEGMVTTFTVGRILPG